MRNIFRKVLGILLIIAAGVCLFFAFRQYNTYEEGKEEYEVIEHTFTQSSPDKPEDTFSVDWNSLQATNPDVVGWIRMDPSVSYPIVKGTDNSFYLNHGVERGYNINGAIFMNAENEPDFTDSNTIIYGHNMINGEMFGNNKIYHDKQYAKDHPYIYIDTPTGRFTYQIFDVITAYDATAPFNINVNDKSEFENYLRECMNMKEYGLDVQVSTEDKIITLSTCTGYGDKRFLIQAVMISYTDTNGTTISDDEWRKQTEQKAEEILTEEVNVLV